MSALPTTETLNGYFPQVESPTAQRSLALNELGSALSKAQAKIKAANKDATNPHFSSKYADLASVWDACREALTEQGLSVVQLPCGSGDNIGLTTTLLHASGQWMASTIYAMPERKGPQAVGSVLTYLRRYALAAAVGVAPEDDDGEAASGGSAPNAPGPANDNGRRFATAPRLARPNAAPPPAKDAPPSSSEPTTRAQMRRYHMLRDAMNVPEDEGRERVSALVGRKVESITDLTVAEMSRVLDKMSAAAGTDGAA